MNKIKKTLLILFCVLFFSACVFFSLGMLIPGASDAAEGAGSFPAFIIDGKINSDFGDGLETWFSKTFAFRGKVVDAFSALREKVFHTGNDQVIVGEDGFLFFAETLDAFTGNDPMTNDEIEAAAQSLLNLQKYAEEHGCEFVFAPAPDKATIYPDRMPPRYEKTSAPTDLDRLFSELDSLGVNYIDLRPLLTKAAEDTLVYHKRDTHWNGRGALLAWEKIAERIGVVLPDFGEAVVTHDFEGDLDALLYPGHTAYDDDLTYDFTDRFIYTSAYSNPMQMSVSTRGGGEKKVLLFRDSFANALIPLVASSTAEAKFERANPYRADILGDGTANGYDAAVAVIAERNLRDLIGCDSRITGDKTADN